ncbi:hypothetical protein [Actinocorallia populi]|uniref:hypothetical protein n=1 Tax=Actinocorallia populi TaxID=2079200 RepID=UPI0013001953|nr:hypothetical protein [Actinocorallia populi]
MTVSPDENEEYGMAELKHLLTVAGEDRPPGIDLLDGLDLPVRRRPARRRGVLAGLTAGAVAAGAAVALTVVWTPQSAQATVLEAVARNEGKPYHVEMVTQASPGGDPFPLTGDFDPGSDSGHLEAPDGGRIIMLGDTGYQKLPESMQSSRGMRSPDKDGKFPKVPKGWKPVMVPLGENAWLKLPMDHVTWGFGSSTRSFAQDPQGELDAIRKADQVKEEGPAGGPGWTGERYSFTTPAVKKWFGRESSSGTVDIDSEGDVRALDVTLTYPDAKSATSVNFKIVFSAYGTPVKLSAPDTPDLYTEQSLHRLLTGRHLPAGAAYGIPIY